MFRSLVLALVVVLLSACVAPTAVPVAAPAQPAVQVISEPTLVPPSPTAVPTATEVPPTATIVPTVTSTSTPVPPTATTATTVPTATATKTSSPTAVPTKPTSIPTKAPVAIVCGAGQRYCMTIESGQPLSVLACEYVVPLNSGIITINGQKFNNVVVRNLTGKAAVGTASTKVDVCGAYSGAMSVVELK